MKQVTTCTQKALCLKQDTSAHCLPCFCYWNAKTHNGVKRGRLETAAVGQKFSIMLHVICWCMLSTHNWRTTALNETCGSRLACLQNETRTRNRIAYLLYLSMITLPIQLAPYSLFRNRNTLSHIIGEFATNLLDFVCQRKKILNLHPDFSCWFLEILQGRPTTVSS